MKKLFFLLLLFFQMVFCLQLNVTVSDVEGTPLPGSTVSIFKGENLLASNKTFTFHKLGEKRKALSTFELENGVYFVSIERSSFSPSLFIINLESDFELNSILIKNSSSYLLYGKLKNPEAFVGKTLSVLDKTGKVVSKSQIYNEGYFLLNYLYPFVQYRLAFLDEPRKFGQYFSYSAPGYYYLEPDLKWEEEFKVQQLSLHSPEKIEVGEKIIALLKIDEKPLQNQKIILTLPSNETLELQTNELGQVFINAAEEGKYVFEYNNLSSITLAYKIEKVQPKPQQIFQNISQNQQNKEKDNTNEKDFTPPIQPQKQVFNSDSLNIFLLILTSIISIIIFILLYIFFFRKEQK